MSEAGNKDHDVVSPLSDRQVLLHALKVVGSIIHLDSHTPSAPEILRRMTYLDCLSDEDRQAVINKAESMM